MTVLPGTRIGEFGDPLWEAGLALANQGDIETQAIAGAVATGTHGSGLGLRSFSATLRACRIVNGLGEVVEIDETTPELLRAAQVAVGMLGVMTSLTLEVAPAYRLAERIEHRPFARRARALGRALRGPPPLLVLLAAERGLGAALRPAHAARRAHDGHLLHEDLRRGRRRTSPTTRRPVAGSTAATASTRWTASSRTSTSSSTWCPPSAVARPSLAMRELMLKSQPIGDLPDGGADDRGRRRLPLGQLRHADDGDLRLGPARHRLLGLPLRRRPAARPVRRARALGQAALPHARAARRALPRERALHRPPPRARPRRACS